MPWNYIVSRLAMFFVTIFIASTIVFFLPRISGQNPLEEKLLEEAARGGFLEDTEAMVAAFDEKYGFNKPLWEQYVKFMVNIVQFDLGRSIFNWPKTVNQLLAETILWTLALGLLTLIFAFVAGTLMGAVLEWKRQKTYLMAIMSPILTLSAVPYYLFGLVLLLAFSFVWSIFPLFGGYSRGIAGWPDWSNWSFIGNVLWHATLPALSVVLVSLGGWAMGMRGMMVTTKGEDYMLQAEAKGLPDRVMFFSYGIRNSLLPQLTGLALQLGLIVSGLVLVEVVFSYPGVGGLLVQAIPRSDHAVIQGIVFVLALGTALATLILDLVYPFIDARIKYSQA